MVVPFCFWHEVKWTALLFAPLLTFLLFAIGAPPLSPLSPPAGDPVPLAYLSSLFPHGGAHVARFLECADEIGVQLEEPFGVMPLVQICERIRLDCQEIMVQTTETKQMAQDIYDSGTRW